MHLEYITDLLETPDNQTVRTLLDDRSTLFWVDWRGDEDSIVKDCEAILQTGKLTAEWIPSDHPSGSDLYITFGERRLCAPLIEGIEDRHIALCTLNRALCPEYEVRLCIDSSGSDTLAFLPLPITQWTELEQRYGPKVGKHFYRLADHPNVFTEDLPFLFEREHLS